MSQAVEKAKLFVRKYLFEGEVLRLMSLTIVSKPIGLATQMLLASSFGAGFAYDAYILSFFFVNFLSNTLSRVFAAVAIPFLTSLKKNLDSDTLNAFVNAMVLIFLIPMVIFAVFVVFVPGPIVGLGAPGAPVETKRLAIEMLRVMAFPAVLMLSVELLKSILNLNSAFRIPTAMPIVNSLTTFTVLLLGHQKFGIWALPVAFATSNFLQLVIILSFAIRKKIAVWIRPGIPAGLLRQLWSSSWMVLVSTIILVINLFVDKVFASGMEPGSVSSIAYSRALEGFGMQVFSFSLVTVMFTKTSRLIADGDLESCNTYISSNIQRLVRLAVPVCLAVALASEDIVYVLFQRNAFVAADTQRTASVLAMYMLGLPAFLTNMVVANIFHSLGKFRDKIWLAMQFILTNITGNWILMGPMGVTGLAVSSSVAINLHLFLSLWFLHRYRIGIFANRYFQTVLYHYLFGVLTWIIYQILARMNVVHDLEQGISRFAAVGQGAYKFLVISLIFGAIILVNRKIGQAWRGRGQKK